MANSGDSSSTNHNEDAEVLNGDYDNRFGMGYDSVIETDDAYYFCPFSGTFLYYFDKDSGVSDVLCGKPECLHDAGKGEPSCNGNICQIGTSVNLWDGRLHYYSTDYENRAYALYSISLDGSDRRKDIAINDSTIMNGLTPQRLDYHRGKLYGWGYNEIVTDGIPYNSICIFSIDAQTGSFMEVFRQDSLTGLTLPNLYYYQNFVYISFETLVVDDENQLEQVNWHLLRWNISTEKIEEVALIDSDELGYKAIEYRIYIEDDSYIWFAPKSNNMEEPARVYLLENGQCSEAFRFEGTGPCFLIEDAAISIFIFEKRWEIRRLDGTLIYKGEIDLSFLNALSEDSQFSLESISSIMGNSEEVLIAFAVETDDESGTRICLVRYDMTDEKPVPTLIANVKCN